MQIFLFNLFIYGFTLLNSFLFMDFIDCIRIELMDIKYKKLGYVIIFFMVFFMIILKNVIIMIDNSSILFNYNYLKFKFLEDPLKKKNVWRYIMFLVKCCILFDFFFLLIFFIILYYFYNLKYSFFNTFYITDIFQESFSSFINVYNMFFYNYLMFLLMYILLSIYVYHYIFYVAYYEKFYTILYVVYVLFILISCIFFLHTLDLNFILNDFSIVKNIIISILLIIFLLMNRIFEKLIFFIKKKN